MGSINVLGCDWDDIFQFWICVMNKMAQKIDRQKRKMLEPFELGWLAGIEEAIQVVEARPRGKQWLGGMIVADDNGEILHRKTLLAALQKLKQNDAHLHPLR
jgi:hypothetical protein